MGDGIHRELCSQALQQPSKEVREAIKVSEKSSEELAKPYEIL